MLSIPHLIIIFVVALVVFGPEKLPELARNLGKVMGEFRRATGDLRSTFEGHLRDLEREADLRRIGGGTNPASPATSGAAAAASVEQPAGTVPTSAPTSAERAEPTPATGAAPEAQEPKVNSETTSDGGHIPA
ncbi:MAG TPA: twin-arginine translocase TatA/TatE family subunit [Candidatus Acidoferrum sp.]|nr:twin-arginine translocase TatA/TatE family subunit [Candidatus Acidoferrum sp.]